MDMMQNDTAEIENAAGRYEVLRGMGDCYSSVGNYGQAQRCYEKAAAL